MASGHREAPKVAPQVGRYMSGGEIGSLHSAGHIGKDDWTLSKQIGISESYKCWRTFTLIEPTVFFSFNKHKSIM